jgi:aspartate/methionine/tyrosine aminotransferase
MYSEMSKQQLAAILKELQSDYARIKAEGLSISMARGVPSRAQEELSKPILDALTSKSTLVAENGIDCGNYGGFDGIPEAKRFMGDILGADPDDVFVGGTSSLNLMHDMITYCWLHPLPGCDKPWGAQGNGRVKFLCPSPGYDRHFAVTEHIGFELVPVPMLSTGPDMDVVEELVKDPAVKGIWSVPKYSNPTGITYSDATVRRFARLRPAAKDFRVFWDNSYAVHDLYPDEPDELLHIMDEAKKESNEDIVLMFTSTSKVSFAGAGIAAMAASKANLDFLKSHMFYQIISHDKLNQLRHTLFFKDHDGLLAHMRSHAELLRPKFELVLSILQRELVDAGIAHWEKPRGGYFITVDVFPGTAKRVVALCKDAGVAFTPAGATHPYGLDPDDKTIRFAPSFPPLDELGQAAKLFCVCAKLAAAEKMAGL